MAQLAVLQDDSANGVVNLLDYLRLGAVRVALVERNLRHRLSIGSRSWIGDFHVLKEHSRNFRWAREVELLENKRTKPFRKRLRSIIPTFPASR